MTGADMRSLVTFFIAAPFLAIAACLWFAIVWLACMAVLECVATWETEWRWRRMLKRSRKERKDE